MDTQFVYLLVNPAMPDFVKVGKTKNLQKRINELSRATAVPLSFECYAYLKVPGDLVFSIEGALHKLLGVAYSKKKEFFKTSPEAVLGYFETVVTINPSLELVICSQEEEAPLPAVVPNVNRKNTTFELLQLPVGTVLTFCDDPEVTCIVADKKNHVTYKGGTTSLSHIACEIKQFNVNGFDYFVFEGETLFQRRLRLEKEKH